MSVKPHALPGVQPVSKPAHGSHPLMEIWALMSWWDRSASLFVVVSTVVCFILLVLLMNGQL